MAVLRPKPVYPILSAIRDQLAEIAGVATCKIGLETGLSPDDYPIIRVVPVKLTGKGTAQQIVFTVYYGDAITESDGGLEAVYESLMALGEAIRLVLAGLQGVYSVNYIDTITDEDRLAHYKIFASRFELLVGAAARA
jgi:hypothetical protein